MAATTSPVSPVSLNQLPRPYDISAAVQQVLSLNHPDTSSFSEFQDKPSEEFEQDCDCLDEEEIEQLLPELDMLENVWSDVTLPDLDKGTSADNSANMEELERFCKYIDGDDDEMPEVKQEPLGGINRKPRALPSSKSCIPRKVATSNYNVSLENAELWQQFSQIGTEMVITKNGRRMFPAISIIMDNLNPEDIYSIYLDILPADDRRYKFMQTEWLPVGKVDKKFNYRSYIHPESPNTGGYWMEKPVSFKFLKLTNNKGTVYRDQVILNSMQKYQPTIRLVCETSRLSQTFQFPETAFIAVTAYQNSKITQLKIDNNPYARAFRDSVGSDSGGIQCSSTSSCNNSDAIKRGGHYRHSSKSSLPPSIMKHGSVNNTNRGSATSVESGFESSSSTEILGWVPIPGGLHQPLESPYECPPLNYWADESCMYNNSLVYLPHPPPPLIDSYPEAFLHQNSHMYVETPDALVSPIKPLQNIPQPPPPPLPPLYTDHNCFTSSKPPFIINLSFEEDDDVFI